MFPNDENIHPQSYAIIGAAAVLSGSTRLTYSLAVIMLETTQNVDMFLPILFSLFASYAMGSVFNRSLYVGTLRAKNIPVLEKTPPMINRKILASTMMTHPVRTLNFIASVSSITTLLANTFYHGFPVINSKRGLRGVIGRNVLIIILKHKLWYKESTQQSKAEQE